MVVIETAWFKHSDVRVKGTVIYVIYIAASELNSALLHCILFPEPKIIRNFTWILVSHWHYYYYY